jgi:para-aminobenzoate synthetase/4-amino-4-deoxychorismate lyase
LEDDRRRGKSLGLSAKNRAENVMIVDLMRNDLGRICRAGSVKTTRLFEVERFPSVWQMTSTVAGKLSDACTPGSIVRALFPSGSVTGAPKIRAMELISELETTPRGMYTGSIGYFAPTQAQFNVAIRTAVLQHQEGLMGGGRRHHLRFVQFRRMERIQVQGRIPDTLYAQLQDHRDAALGGD